MIKRYTELAADFLEKASDQLSNNGCNDWEWPKGWTVNQKKKLVQEYHEWNGDPEELEWLEEEHYTGKYAPLPDFAVASFLAHKMVD